MSVDQFRTAMYQSVLVTRVEGTCITSSAAPLNSYFACMSLLRRPLPPGGFCQYMLQCEAFPRLYERNDFPTVRRHSQEDLTMVRSFRQCPGIFGEISCVLGIGLKSWLYHIRIRSAWFVIGALSWWVRLIKSCIGFSIRTSSIRRGHKFRC